MDKIKKIVDKSADNRIAIFFVFPKAKRMKKIIKKNSIGAKIKIEIIVANMESIFIYHLFFLSTFHMQHIVAEFEYSFPLLYLLAV